MADEFGDRLFENYHYLRDNKRFSIQILKNPDKNIYIDMRYQFRNRPDSQWTFTNSGFRMLLDDFKIAKELIDTMLVDYDKYKEAHNGSMASAGQP